MIDVGPLPVGEEEWRLKEDGLRTSSLVIIARLSRALAHSNDASERATERIECFPDKKFKEGKSRLLIILRPLLRTATVEKGGVDLRLEFAMMPCVVEVESTPTEGYS
ncbi:hypothetical protein V495_02650 [Pseudogymnoascus sp. VKM F-4514 (FW-929)]|nr:hypothetical protein V495_02650 [Pseudogymnoascus sp. VKM F-4514 (FW-929)]KFY61128.1 hypothetical protein V497_03138 [Pseudogymnoascus sp. VKM F-4516 (FW-969)]